MTESNRSENQNKRRQQTVDPDHQQSQPYLYPVRAVRVP